MTAQRRRERLLLSRGAGLWLFLGAFAHLGQVALLLRVRGFQRIVREIDARRPPPRATVAPRDIRRAQRYARQLERASRCYLPRVRCLHRSLVLHRWLLREGLPSELHIGVNKEGGALAAHAWVELVGVVVNDSAAAVSAFTPLADITTPHRASRGVT
jgi:hypothetical protein